MNRSASHLAALLCLAATFAGAEESRSQILATLRELPDQQLHTRLGGLLSKDNFRWKLDYELCLTEIVRRGRADGASSLQKHFDVLMARRFKLSDDIEDTDPGSFYNLELLTAMRRIQKQPDPLKISVEHMDGPLKGTPLALPRLKVSIKNVDAGRKEVGFQFGGNYRSGRQARWCVMVVDQDDVMSPTKQLSGAIIGGGLSTEGTLKHGESWETVLDMRDFIEPPLPGRYDLQVLYHDTETIFFEDDLAGLIVFQSEKIPFVVSPTVLALTREEERSARQWIAALKPSGPTKVVAGTYDEWAHDFIPPDSPAGSLLRMGLIAAPTLVEALQDDTVSADKRAWLFSLLYSVTGMHDPRNGSAMAGYEYVTGSWQVWGGRPGEGQSGGIGFGGEGSSSGGEISLKAQKKLTKQWADWLQTVEVKRAE